MHLPSWLLFAFLAACAQDPAPADDSAAPADATPTWCDTATEVAWADFGEGFLLTHCQGCHASTAPDRHGAPEGAVFDTEEDALDRAEAILRTVLEEQSMPPAGGVTEDERVLLETWLSCG